MNTVFVVDREQQWPFEIPGSSAIGARAYLTDRAYGNGVDAQVVNLCRYQGRGYHVSLPAEARGQSPLPDVKAIDAGNEDQVLQGALHREVMGVFARRIAQHRRPRGLSAAQ